MELHETVAVPEVVILLGVIEPQVSPVGTVSVRVTVPVNPFRAVTVIVDVTEVPVGTEAGEVAVMVKSGAGLTLNVTVAECDSDPLVPVTVTVNVPLMLPVHESVELACPPVCNATAAGFMRHARPVEGDALSVRLTVLLNPFRLETVMIDVPVVPVLRETEVGLALTVKSGAGVTL